MQSDAERRRKKSLYMKEWWKRRRAQPDWPEYSALLYKKHLKWAATEKGRRKVCGYSKKWRDNNKPWMRDYFRKWNAAHRDLRRAYNKAWKAKQKALKNKPNTDQQ